MDAAEKQDLLKECTRCACFNLRKTARAITKYYDSQLQPVGLRTNQFSILTVVATAGALPIGTLAAQLVMDRTTLTRNLGPLKKNNFIEVIPGADSRQRIVALTEHGRKTLMRALPLWAEANSTIENQMGTKQFDNLLHGLSDIRESLDATAES